MPDSPVYESLRGKSYQDWLIHWSTRLLSLLKCPRQTRLFTAALPALRKDLRIAEFLLPNLVVAVLGSGGEQEEAEVLGEVQAVMTVKEQDTVLQQLVAQAVFSVLDHVSGWLRHKSTALLAATKKEEGKLTPDEIKNALSRSKENSRVVHFQSLLPHEDLANVSYQTKAFHRSVFYLDQYLRRETTVRIMMPEELDSLQKLYAALDEPDLVLGVAATRVGEPPLEQLILQHEATGSYQDALCCYEAAGRSSEPSSRLGMIQCYLSIDQPATAASLAAGVVAHNCGLREQLAPLQAEAAWQLGHWDDLETLTKAGGQDGCLGWELGLGRLLSSLQRKDWPTMRSTLTLTRRELLEPLAAGSVEQGAYTRGYSHIGRLGVLNEVERLAERFLVVPERDLVASRCDDLLKELQARLTYTQQSWGSLEPVHRVRRAVLGLARDRLQRLNTKMAERLQFEVGESWLKSAQVARECGQLQEAYSFMLEVKKFQHIEFFLETAQLAWARGQHTRAVNTLKRGLADAFPYIWQAWQAEDNVAATTAAARLTPDNRRVCWRGKLLLAQYLEEASSVGKETIQKTYMQAVALDRNSSEVFFHYARHMDKQVQNFDDNAMLGHADLLANTCTLYIKSMLKGPQHIHHCLPRMLSLWLDLAKVLQDGQSRRAKEPELALTLDHGNKHLVKLNTVIRHWAQKAPSYHLLTAAPQLVSRICHAHQETFVLLQHLLVHMLVKHPQQAFWHLVSVSKNKDLMRRSRCNDIFKDACKQEPKLNKFLEDALAMTKKIDELCDIKVDKGKKDVQLKDIMKSLPALVNNSSFSSVILPNQRNMIVSLPTVTEGTVTVLNSYNPFPAGLVMIDKIQQEVVVMNSLVAPKKITFRGDDGKLYPFLAKPKDDLRRDCRLMDFCFLLNKLFRKDAESRKRDLHIRTYTVVPTNETSGLIEWVDNLKGLRPIILQKHKERGLNLGGKWPARYLSEKKDSLEKKRNRLERCVEDQKGAVFSDWFAHTFHDPQTWLMARMAYTRTTAVMSMVGYIIGLGDRHLENINVDTTNGETFHVDMNCLFNKGETFEWPEMVPFRLTHNMVDAFGPLGVEGPFRWVGVL